MNTVIDPGRWEGSVAAARAQQLQLAGRVERQDRLPRNVRWLAGMDVGFEDNGAITRAAAVLLDAETLKPVAQEIARIPTVMPYIPGLLSFRELPALLAALRCCHACRTWCSSMVTASAIRAGWAWPRIWAWSPTCRASG